MITIKNKQRTVSINANQLEADAQKILQLLDYAEYDLGIWLTSNATIRKFNREYRTIDKATDILSFSFWPNLKPGQRIRPTKEDEKNLGDLIISPAYVKQDSKKLGIPFEERMRELLIHGICHLLGYDHVSDADYAVMHKKEQALLKKLKS